MIWLPAARWPVAGGLGMKDMLQSMVGIVIALVAIHIIFHIVISLDDVEEAEDERDKAVARRASVFGFNVLFVPPCCSCWAAS